MTTTTLYILLGMFMLTHIFSITIIFKYADVFKEGWIGIILYLTSILLPPIPYLIITFSLISENKAKTKEQDFNNQLLNEMEKINEKLK